MAMKIGLRPEKWRRKKARQGMRGYPVGTIAFYGPDDQRASKAAASVIRHEGAEAELRRWFSETGDLRTDPVIASEIAAYLRQHAVHSVAMVDGIIGCPHEEGVDYRWARVARTARFGRGGTVGQESRIRASENRERDLSLPCATA